MDWLTIVLFLVGFMLLILGAELLVRGASHLAVAAGVSPLVVGLTVVAYGTSAPEVAVAVQASWAGQSDLAIGNVVGSNIANVLLILGLAASVSPLLVARQLVRFDVPLMIGLSLLVPLLAANGNISRLEGLLLIAGAIAYTAVLVYVGRRTPSDRPAPEGEAATAWRGSIALGITRDGVFILVGLALLVLGANWLVAGAVKVAKLLGIDELIIGLTIVAVGTSLPEIATSIVAALRGQRDLAVGNVVGSNIFNILLVLGLGSLAAPEGLSVSKQALQSDIPIMVGVAVACLPIFYAGLVVSRWEGILLLGSYGAYTLYLVLQATGHWLCRPYCWFLLCVALPIAVLVLAANALLHFLRRKPIAA